ncbi:MAG: hypothetical protein RIE56_05870 [Amphiplicatus sp.]
MSTESDLLYGAMQTMRTRYVYFLLAIAAASIAFAITQTDDLALSYSQAPLAVATLFWALSFFSGCRQQIFYGSILYTNFERLRVQSGNYELAGRHPEKIKIGEDFLLDKIKGSEKSLLYYSKWQFWFYIIGAVFFIGWHILEMYFRSRI